MDRRIIRCGSQYADIDIPIAVFDLISSANFRDECLDVLRVACQGRCIISCQCSQVPCDTPVPPRTGGNRENVSAKRFHLLVDLLLRAGSESDHRNNGRNADDDAKHCECGTKEVAANRLKRDPERFGNEHGEMLPDARHASNTTGNKDLQPFLRLNEVRARQQQHFVCCLESRYYFHPVQIGQSRTHVNDL